MRPKRDINTLIGKRFGRLVITGYGAVKGKEQYYSVICDCGNTKECQLGHLEHGNTLSCGCLKIENVLAKNKLHPANFKHGLYKHHLWKVYNMMKSRCYCKTNSGYPNYGGRGVIVCKEWLDDFMNFYNWAINNGWKKGLQLDKDKRSPHKVGNIYCPKYCSFLTSKENMQYRSNSISLKYNGKTKNLSQWIEELKLDGKIIRARYKKGWSIKDMFEKPIREAKLIEFKNKKKTLPKWCDFLKVDYAAISARINKLGWSVEKALSTPIRISKNNVYPKKQIA